MVCRPMGNITIILIIDFIKIYSNDLFWDIHRYSYVASNDICSNPITKIIINFKTFWKRFQKPHIMIDTIKDFITSVNLFDFIVALIFTYCVLQCFIKGFSLSLISFMKWVFSTILTIMINNHQ